MADIAIDPTDIRSPAPSGEAPRPRLARKTILIAGGIALGVAAIGGAAAAIVSHITLPASLSGLASLPKPEAPRRSEIRIGRLPDMPEIRDGVPAVIGTKPVRVVETPAPAAPASLDPRPVAVSVVPAATLPAAPLPTTFSNAGGPQLVSTAAAPAVSTRLEAPSAAPLPSAPPARVSLPVTSVSAPTPAREPEVKAAAPASVAKVESPPPAEPSATASLSAPVPLPPPAPTRSLARAPDVKQDKVVPRPAQIASRQALPAATPSPVDPPPAPAAAPEDRVEVLGVKLPNGNDLRNAVSSIGEALNLPKAF